MSSSQPTNMGRTELSEVDYSQLSEEPSMSQFTANPHLPESLVPFFPDMADGRLNEHLGSRIYVLRNV
jgi:hypothetical protein